MVWQEHEKADESWMPLQSFSVCLLKFERKTEDDKKTSNSAASKIMQEFLLYATSKNIITLA